MQISKMLEMQFFVGGQSAWVCLGANKWPSNSFNPDALTRAG